LKLDFDTATIEKSQDFEEQTFGMSDVTVVMEILRSKLYSNPIKVLVQEYMSNARDAHREIDNNQPIEVLLPSHISPQFEVRDYGPGITPHRMNNVFINYAASTKRDTNKQTGGWGLGSKSGWSYSDTFSVITITNETGENVRRSYACIIDETRNGKLIKLCDDVKTDEACGTRIIVPVRKENFNQFRDYAIQTAMLWEVKPIIFGDTITTPIIISEGNKWKYFERTTAPKDFATNKTFVVYDGIPYPLKTETLKDLISTDVMGVLNSSCFGLYFDIGEITISANREEIQYTEKTKETLAKRVNDMVSEVASEFSSTIQQEPTFLDALMKFNEICQSNNVIGKLINNSVEWNGTKLHTLYHISALDTIIRIDNFFNDDGKLRHNKTHTIHLSNKDILEKIYINDEKLRGPPLSKIRSLYYSSSELEQDTFDIYVISYRTNNTKGLSANDISMSNTKINKWNSDHFISLLELSTVSSIKKLSNIPKDIKINKEKNIPYRKLKINNDCSFIQEHEDVNTNISGYYTIISDGRFSICGQAFNTRDGWSIRHIKNKLSLIFDYLKINEILLFTPKQADSITKDNTKLMPLSKNLPYKIVESYDINKIKKYIEYIKTTNMYSHRFFNILTPSIHKEKFNKDSKVYQKLQSMIDNESYIKSLDFNSIDSLFKEFGYFVREMYKFDESHDEDSFSNKYPLLDDRYYNNSNNERLIEHAIAYINLVDNQNF
jgi:hypothetical protein